MNSYDDFISAFNFKDSCNVDVWSDPCDAKAKYLEINFTCADAGNHIYFDNTFFAVDNIFFAEVDSL